MDNESREVSLRLFNILEKVGVSERMRQLRRGVCIKQEIRDTIIDNMQGGPIVSQYIFGSSIEGTTTPDMNSDQDIVYCNESILVIDHMQDASLRNNEVHLLVVTDSNTKPGYVKLQAVKDVTLCTVDNLSISDIPGFGIDKMGRLCLKHSTTREEDCYDYTTRGGPADTLHLPGAIETDMVSAVRSRTYPRAAVEPLLECTRAGWLTRDDVEEMIQYGCFYVGVGHPASEEKDYEWRISFSQQERKMMLGLNSTQHKCYVLLKFIKDMLTSAPDVGKSITSYHCKTCLFKVIVKTRSEQWLPENLILRTFDCLTELQQCLRDGTYPNFFIRTNNMFERRVYGKVKERLIHYVNSMLNEGYPVFFRIKSENIGDALREQRDNVKMEICLIRTTFQICINSCTDLGIFIMTAGKFLKDYPKEDATLFLFNQLCYLSSAIQITEHTESDTKAAIRDLEPILHRFYAAHMASLAFSIDVHESKDRLLHASARHLQHAMSFDLMSSRLLHTTILYRQGKFDLCCNQLERLELNLHDAVISTCICYPYNTYNTAEEMLLVLSRYPGPQSMKESSVAICTVFLPSHAEFIPTALQYELYRSVATPPGSRAKIGNYWFDMAAVDSKVYLYFMLYLVCSRLNRPAARRLATVNLMKQLLKEVNLGHRETGYNLLGWIYSQEGQIESAAYCFLQSWRIRPQHNAAKWHMLNLIYCQYVARQ